MRRALKREPRPHQQLSLQPQEQEAKGSAGALRHEMERAKCRRQEPNSLQETPDNWCSPCPAAGFDFRARSHPPDPRGNKGPLARPRPASPVGRAGEGRARPAEGCAGTDGQVAMRFLGLAGMVTAVILMRSRLPSSGRQHGDFRGDVRR